MSKKLLLIDGMSILYRAYHAKGQMLSLPDGTNITALYVFTRMVLRFLEYVKPSHLLICFDTKGKNFRHELYSEYKAQRKPMEEDLVKQIPFVYQFLEEANIAILKKENYEADDLIGTLSRLARIEGFKTYILSGDRDDLQLINDDVSLIYPQRAGAFKVYTPELFAEEYGFPVADFVDYKALHGDSSDNIPGVKGIGSVIASTLISNFASLENLYTCLDDFAKTQEGLSFEKHKLTPELKSKGLKTGIYKNLMAEREQAFFSRQLAKIDQYVPVDINFKDFILPEFKNTELYNYLEQFYFSSLVKQFRNFEEEMKGELIATRGQENELMPYRLQNSLKNKTRAEANSASDEASCDNFYKDLIDLPENISDISDFPKIIADNREAKLHFLFLQANWKAECDFYLAKEGKKKTKERKNVYQEMPQNLLFLVTEETRPEKNTEELGDDNFSKKNKTNSYLFLPSDEELIEIIDTDLLNKCKSFVCNDLKSLLKKLINKPEHNLHTFDFKEFFTRCASLELLDYSLGNLRKEYIFLEILNENYQIEKLENVPFVFGLSNEGQNFWQYYLAACRYFFILSSKLWHELKQQGEFFDFVKNVDFPLCLVAAEMELRGAHIDTAYLKSLNLEMQAEILATERQILAYSKEDFNLQSPQQLSEFLFNELNLSKTKKLSNGYSTNQESLESIKDEHPVISLILRYRSLQKLINSFVEPLLAACDENDDVHTSYNLNLTSTGRLSSSNPNLQNIPVRQTEGKLLRRAFVAREPYLLLASDYSQIELRLLAHMSQDEVMLNAYKNGLDIHSLTAANIFKLDPSSVTPEMRQIGKTINFSVIYGISEFSLSKDLNISYQEAKSYIKSYYASFPKIGQFLHELVQKAEDKTYASTLFARRRYIKELKDQNHNVRQFGMRAAMNAPIQGTSADLIRKAMCELYQAIKKEGLDARLIMQIHDELILEVNPKDLDRCTDLVTSVMMNVAKLDVALEINANYGHNWAEVK